MIRRTPEAQARHVLRANHWIVTKIDKVCDEDWTGSRLVLFRGRQKNDKSSRRHEALIRGETIVNVELGWGDPVEV